jgi:hypothetical protein
VPAVALDAPLTRIRSNILALESSFAFSGREYYSAAYASMAHLFSSRWTSITIAASDELGASLAPLGSHPLLDPLYSSAAFDFRYDATGRGRLEKVGAVARAGLAEHLVVCHEAPLPEGDKNCGRCEKCVRTMAELAAVGSNTASFPSGGLTPAAIDVLPVRLDAELFWEPLIPALRRAGREPLAEAAARYVRRIRIGRAWNADSGWKGRLRRFDRRFIGARLLRTRRFLSRKAPRGESE